MATTPDAAKGEGITQDSSDCAVIMREREARLPPSRHVRLCLTMGLVLLARSLQQAWGCGGLEDKHPADPGSAPTIMER